MTRYFNNLFTLLTTSHMLIAYGRWAAARAFGLRSFPRIIVANDATIGHFIKFSEYWLWRHGIDAADLSVVTTARALAGSSPTAVDVGANIGFFSLALASLGFDRVFALEPVPDTCQRLLANLSLNPLLGSRIEVIQAAAGDGSGTAEIMVFPESPGQNKFAIAKDCKLFNHRTIPISVVRLDDFCSERGIERIDFLKIDVEGFEYQVLCGARRMLAEHKIGAVLLEVIPLGLHNAGVSLSDLECLFHDVGMEAVRPTCGGFEACDFSSAVEASGSRNVFCILKRTVPEPTPLTK